MAKNRSGNLELSSFDGTAPAGPNAMGSRTSEIRRSSTDQPTWLRLRTARQAAFADAGGRPCVPRTHSRKDPQVTRRRHTAGWSPPRQLPAEASLTGPNFQEPGLETTSASAIPVAISAHRRDESEPCARLTQTLRGSVHVPTAPAPATAEPPATVSGRPPESRTVTGWMKTCGNSVDRVSRTDRNVGVNKMLIERLQDAYRARGFCETAHSSPRGHNTAALLSPGR